MCKQQGLNEFAKDIELESVVAEESGKFRVPLNRETAYQTAQHPLINADSPHYQMVDGQESILLMEQMFTVEELKAWAKITSYKYRFRLGKKDDNSKDIKKMQTYEAYYKYLCLDVELEG